MLLVSLSFTSMFQQAKASGDRAGGQVGRCRCTELAGIAASHCSPQKCASWEAIHPGTWAGRVIWASVVDVQHADSSLQSKSLSVQEGIKSDSGSCAIELRICL